MNSVLANFLISCIILKPIVHEIVMKNQVIFVTPTIEETRLKLFEFVFKFESILTNQRRIQYTYNHVIFNCFFLQY